VSRGQSGRKPRCRMCGCGTRIEALSLSLFKLHAFMPCLHIPGPQVRPTRSACAPKRKRGRRKSARSAPGGAHKPLQRCPACPVSVPRPNTTRCVLSRRPQQPAALPLAVSPAPASAAPAPKRAGPAACPAWRGLPRCQANAPVPVPPRRRPSAPLPRPRSAPRSASLRRGRGRGLLLLLRPLLLLLALALRPGRRSAWPGPRRRTTR
jgi:hypothetical protein